MATPIVRDSAASNISVTGANTIATAAYSNSADVLRIQLSALAANYLLADFRLTLSFATAPVAGSIQLVKVPRDFSDNQGPAPSALLVAGNVWTFSPSFAASNTTKTSIILAVDAVPLDLDQDFWLFNNGTAQTISTGYVLVAAPWSPGT